MCTNKTSMSNFHYWKNLKNTSAYRSWSLYLMWDKNATSLYSMFKFHCYIIQSLYAVQFSFTCINSSREKDLGVMWELCFLPPGILKANISLKHSNENKVIMLHFLEWKGTENPLVTFKTSQDFYLMFCLFFFFPCYAATLERQAILSHFWTCMEDFTGWRVGRFIVSDKVLLQCNEILFLGFFQNTSK